MSVNDCQLPEELHNTTKKHSQTIAINCIIQLLYVLATNLIIVRYFCSQETQKRDLSVFYYIPIFPVL